MPCDKYCRNVSILMLRHVVPHSLQLLIGNYCVHLVHWQTSRCCLRCRRCSWKTARRGVRVWTTMTATRSIYRRACFGVRRVAAYLSGVAMCQPVPDEDQSGMPLIIEIIARSRRSFSHRCHHRQQSHTHVHAL